MGKVMTTVIRSRPAIRHMDVQVGKTATKTRHARIENWKGGRPRTTGKGRVIRHWGPTTHLRCHNAFHKLSRALNRRDETAHSIEGGGRVSMLFAHLAQRRGANQPVPREGGREGCDKVWKCVQNGEREGGSNSSSCDRSAVVDLTCIVWL